MSKGLRARLVSRVTERFGSCDPSSLRTLAEAAAVSYTTLARFVLYPESPIGRKGTNRQLTRKLRRKTVEALAVQLDVSASWLWDGSGSKQLGLWPILVSSTAETALADPMEELSQVLRHLQSVQDRVRIRAARAAVAAVLQAVVADGEMIAADAYRSLMRLDAMHRDKGREAM